MALTNGDLKKIATAVEERLVPRLDALERKIDVVHRDLLSLRAELVGVIDPQFPPVGT